MYRFVRFKLRGSKDTTPGTWWLEVSNFNTLVEHTEKFFRSVMQEGFNDVSSKAVVAAFRFGDATMGMHPETFVGSAIGSIADIRYGNSRSPLALFETANNMLLEALRNRIRDLEKGPVYLENGVRQFGYNPDHWEVEEEIESEELEYPETKKLEESDIRIIQWPGGTHYYAKVGRYDVVDEAQNQKWSSHGEAFRAAKRFLESL